MRNLIAVLLCLLTSWCFAQGVEPIRLNMEIKINGNITSKPNVLINSGETAKITQTSDSSNSSFFIEVTPTYINDTQVKMNFVVGLVENGKEVILSKPKITNVLGKPAHLTLGQDDSAKTQLSLEIVAKKEAV